MTRDELLAKIENLKRLASIPAVTARQAGYSAAANDALPVIEALLRELEELRSQCRPRIYERPEFHLDVDENGEPK